MNWFLDVVKNHYADFSGRARRSEYWYFVLFYVLIDFGLAIVDRITGLHAGASGVGVLVGIFVLAMLIPSIAVAVRRLHDTDRSGWWLLIALIPLIGAIVLLVFYVQEGSAGDNQYGPSPKSLAT